MLSQLLECIIGFVVTKQNNYNNVRLKEIRIINLKSLHVQGYTLLHKRTNWDAPIMIFAADAE